MCILIRLDELATNNLAMGSTDVDTIIAIAS